MIFKFIFNIYLIFLFSIISFNCNAPTELNPSNFAVSLETPVITGIYVSTVENPEGTGEVIGNPSYKVKNINVFPNPYYAIVYPTAYINVREPYFTFNHLPDSVIIIIVKGESKVEAINSGKSNFGASPNPAHAWKVRTIKKNNRAQFYRWDIKDDDGNSIPYGYYRAYFFGKQIPENYFIDMSLKVIDGKLSRY